MAGDRLPAKLTPSKRERALQLIRERKLDIGDIAALRQAGVKGTRGELRALIDSDDELRDAIAEARGRTQEKLRFELWRRAVEGVDEPVFGSLGAGQGSGEIGTKRVYSDKLAETLAKALLPEHREAARLEVGGRVEVHVEHDFAALRDKLVEYVGPALTGRSPAAVDAADPAPERPALLPPRAD